MAGRMTPHLVRVAFTMCGIAGNERVGALLAEHGELGAVRALMAGVAAPVAPRQLSHALQAAETALGDALSRGIRFITSDDDEWPARLADLDLAAPVGLWIRGRGHLSTQAQHQVAIVGARSATPYGERVAAELASHAAHAGVSVVSGGAYGIDAAAHRGALAADGVTVAVMAGGVDVAYPAAHSGLLDRIAADGVVLSEAAPGSGVRKHAFLTRNRLIAALASDTIVVEAALRSGALNTATWAGALGRPVWGTPGPITSPASAGVNQAISEGTMRALADPAVLIDSLATTTAMSVSLSAAVEGVAGAILDAVAAGAATVDAVCAHTSLAAVDVLPVLTLLEVEGRVARTGQGYRVPRGRGA